MSPWPAGETVVLRYFNRCRPSGALPTRAVSDGDGSVLWLAPETTVQWPAVEGRRVREVSLEERYTLPWDVSAGSWRGDGVLILGRPGRAHSIWLFWESRSFAGWYVNLEAPWRPSRFGFDTEDHTLDIWITGDGVWQWKDEHELAVAVELGFCSPEEAASFRAERRACPSRMAVPDRVGGLAARHTSWPLPSLPSGWDHD